MLEKVPHGNAFYGIFLNPTLQYKNVTFAVGILLYIDAIMSITVHNI